MNFLSGLLGSLTGLPWLKIGLGIAFVSILGWLVHEIKLSGAQEEKINVLKTSQPYGYLLYQKLIPNFSQLQRLEENQFNRYIFNKEKKWW